MLCAPIPHSLRSDGLIRTNNAINAMTSEQLRTGILQRCLSGRLTTPYVALILESDWRLLCACGALRRYRRRRGSPGRMHFALSDANGSSGEGVTPPYKPVGGEGFDK
jgi:hypothetical protein